MASVKNIYSLSQPSPAKQHVDMAPRVLKQMSQTFTTIHSVTICLPFLRRYPNYAHPRSSTPLYLFISLGRCTCHVTDRIRMYMCEYDPIKHEPSCMTPDVALALEFILVLEPVPYQLTMACTVFVLILTVSHMPCHMSPITFVCVRAGTIPSFNHHQ